MPIDRPPASSTLADAAVDMIEKQRTGLDDLLQMDIKAYTKKILRLETGLEIIKEMLTKAAAEEGMSEVAMGGRLGMSKAEEFWT